jgi:hypothetical protein
LYNMVLHGKNQFIKVKFNQPLIDYVVLWINLIPSFTLIFIF